MIKGILRIVLLSTVIFFTAQLGWSYTAPGADPNEAKTQGLQAGVLAPGLFPDCPACKAHALQVQLWKNTTGITGTGAATGTDTDTSGGTQ